MGDARENLTQYPNRLLDYETEKKKNIYIYIYISLASQGSLHKVGQGFMKDHSASIPLHDPNVVQGRGKDQYNHEFICIYIYGGTCGVMVTTIGNEHGNPSSNPERGCLYFI